MTNEKLNLEIELENKIFTLVGMSGCGKTTLSQKLANEGFFHYSIDYEIAHTHMQKQIRQFVIDKIKLESKYFKELHETFAVKLELSLTFDDLALITMFVIPENENGKIPFGKFLENQRFYKESELLATKIFHKKAQIAFENYNSTGFISDATGSICEVALEDVPESKELLRLIREKSRLVFIQTDDSHKDLLIARSKEKVKPILYNHQFLMQNLAEFYKMENFPPEFEIDKAFFIQLFPKLLDFRKENYEQLVKEANGIAVNSSEIEKVKTVKDFIKIVFVFQGF